MGIHKKLLEIKMAVEKLTKDSKGFNYNYVSAHQILETVRPEFNDRGLLIYPELVQANYRHVEYEKVSKGKVVKVAEGVIEGTMKYNIVDVETDEKLEILWPLTGQMSDIAQALGAGLSYAERYFYLKMLGVPMDEIDPDRTNTGGDRYTKQGSRSNFTPPEEPSGHVPQLKTGDIKPKYKNNEPVTLEQAKLYKLKSGKLKGKTMEELIKTADGRSMLDWMSDKGKPVIKQMALLVLADAKKNGKGQAALGDDEYSQVDPSEDVLPWEKEGVK